MSDIELSRLRKLRSRAETLLTNLVPDLKHFRHKQELNGFRRKPDSTSPDNDVNITTTCSCLMGLALTAKLGDFYGDDSKKKTATIFQKLIDAPWMSSGLTENNAFTATLILRLFGLLVEAGILSSADAEKSPSQYWEPQLRFSDFSAFAAKLTSQKEPFTKFLFQLLPNAAQKQIELFLQGKAAQNKTESQTVTELQRLISRTYFYDSERFKGVTLSDSATELLKEPSLDGYNVAKLNRILLHDGFAELRSLEKKTLKDIALDLSAEAGRFGINEYPPAAAVVYWFVDGITRAHIELPTENWCELCRFAVDEFGRQRSLAVAKHAAMMDPVAMAMAACLCARLKTTSKDLLLGTTRDHHSMLPSTVELEKAVVDLFREQTESGIWPKYFPLFHYQDAGSNFCFTFELLEAVLVEFGTPENHLLEEELVVAGCEKALTWCDANRLRWSEVASGETISYNGWNSGGNFETLRRGQPESWATAVVHMFLWELTEVLSRHIQHRLLDTYDARRPSSNWKKINDLLDIELLLDRSAPPASLKSTLQNTIVASFDKFKGAKSEQLRKRPVKKVPVSALLFGPPGTSKTEVAKSIAAELDWPLVEIDPSHFLQNSFHNIYVQAEKIFEDAMDMCGVVVLFDEMDALVQKRDAEGGIDTESKFLTTYMLPKLARLHDRGRIVFLMATNFQADFDDAIKRAGRFDFLLCMGPPTVPAKCASVHVFFGLDKETDETKDAGRQIQEWAVTNGWTEDQLSLYTFGEFASFLSGIGDSTEIGNAVRALGKDGFNSRVRDDSQTASLRMEDLDLLRSVIKLGRWQRLKDLDAIDFSEQEVRKSGINTKIPAIKYVLDKKQSRRQTPKSATKIQN